MAVKTLNESTEIRELAKVMALAPTANSLDAIFIAPSVAADGIEFLQTGREVVLIQNSDAASPYTFTLVSVADELNRTGNVGPYTLQAGEIVPILINPKGFKSASTGKVLITMDNAAIKVAVCRIPSQV